MEEFTSALDELTKQLSLVPQLIKQLNTEDTKIQGYMRNCCSELKSEVELKENKMRALQDAFKKLPL